MFILDTETTGLNFAATAEVFSIGVLNCNTDEYHCFSFQIDPFTRCRETEVNPYDKEFIRSVFRTGVILQNVRFDLKGLCKLGVFDWEEPDEPAFWENVVELTHLTHLYSSLLGGSGLSLKKLAPSLLGEDYEDQEELLRIVKRCRAFVRNRDANWKIGTKENLPHEPDQTHYTHCDYWLPETLFHQWEDQHELQIHFRDDFDLLPTVCSKYLKTDCQVTKELTTVLLSSLTETYSEYETLLKINHQLLPVLWSIETTGIRVDQQNLSVSIEELEQKRASLNKELHSLISNQKEKSLTAAEKRKLLFDILDLEPVTLTEKTQTPQTSIDVLMKLKESVLQSSQASTVLSDLLVESKIATRSKYLQSYKTATISKTTGWRKTNTLPAMFPTLNEAGTSTTRFSGKNPNPQNIEKASNPFTEAFPDVGERLNSLPSIRTVFVPAPGCKWILMDYSQLQLRIFARATNDESLMQSFRSGYDFHDFMARTIFSIPDSESPTSAQRRIAKNVNFGFIFGASERKIDKTVGMTGLYKSLMEQFPAAHDFIQQTKENIQKTGYVRTLQGYPLQIPLKITSWGTESYAAHSGVNYIIQGTEGIIVKQAMSLCYNWLRRYYPEGRIVNVIHDEIIFEVPLNVPSKVIRSLAALMETPGDWIDMETPVDIEQTTTHFGERSKWDPKNP